MRHILSAAPFPTPAWTPFPTGASAPLSAGIPAPVSAGASAPLSAGTPAPVSAGASAPVSAGIPAPLSAGASAPVSAGASAPVSAEIPAPVSAGASAPVPAENGGPRDNHLVYISEAAHPDVKGYIKKWLREKSIPEADSCLVEVRATEKTYPAAASHPDLYFCALGERVISGAPSGYRYPDNVGLNGVRLGPFFVHSLKHTAPAVLAEVNRLGLEKINVKQGYTKCSLAVVDGTSETPSVITSDHGIAKALSPYPIHVLLIEKGHVLLPGLPYGFLGGASGSLGNEILFHGNLRAHPDFHKICRFIQEKGRVPLWFDHFPLTDIGSIITLL